MKILNHEVTDSNGNLLWIAGDADTEAHIDVSENSGGNRVLIDYTDNENKTHRISFTTMEVERLVETMGHHLIPAGSDDTAETKSAPVEFLTPVDLDREFYIEKDLPHGYIVVMVDHNLHHRPATTINRGTYSTVRDFLDAEIERYRNDGMSVVDTTESIITDNIPVEEFQREIWIAYNDNRQTYEVFSRDTETNQTRVKFRDSYRECEEYVNSLQLWYETVDTTSVWLDNPPAYGGQQISA
ncbi:MAG: hypothetical protein ACR2QW_18345 [bacterium]